MKFLSLLFIPSLLWAQSAVTLDTIQVRGTKEEKSFYQNPESVSILREKDLPAQGRENNLQILNAVPNVEVNKNGESFSIRGINNLGVTGYQKDNLSSIVIDDVFQTDLALQAGSFDLWDMDRIEVLRGAQSTSQGVNSLAGTILLDHNRANFENSGSAKLAFGNWGHKEAGIVAGNNGFRLSLSKELNDGFIKNRTTGKKDWGGWDKDRIGLDYRKDFTNQSQLLLNAKYFHNKQGGTYSQSADPFDYRVDEDVDNINKTQNVQFSAKYIKPLSDKTTNTTIASFSRSLQKSESDADGTSQNTAGTRFEDHKDYYASLENQLLYKGDTFKNLFGIHAHEFNLKDKYDFNMLYEVAPGTVTQIGLDQTVDRKRNIFSVFDSYTHNLSANQSVIWGARAEYAEASYGTDVLGTRLEDLGPGNNAALDNYLAQVSGDYSGSKYSVVVLPKVGWTYQHENHHYGASYTKGYRTAGVSINRRRAQAISYDAEFTDNFELSYKKSGEILSFSAQGFYIDWRDQQVQVQMSTDFFDTQVQNAGKSQVLGGELEGELKLNKNTFKLGVGYSDTEFKSFKTTQRDYKGNQFPFASHWTSRLSWDTSLMQDLKVMTTLRYVSESYSNAENTRKTDPQFYVNVSSRYLIQSWMLEAYVNNLLDGEFHIFDGRPTNTTSPYQASYHQTSTPREFGARAVYFW